VGAGLSYASLGATHHSCEDIAMMRILPRMSVICPADAYEVKHALRESMKLSGPVYIRLGKKGEPAVHTNGPGFEIGKAITTKDGTDLCLLSTGNMVSVAMQCADDLQKQGISCKVVSFHTVKPLDEKFLQDALTRFPLVATLEEHSVLGGLGASVAEWYSCQDRNAARLVRFGTADSFMCEAGNQQHARRHFGLTPEQIVPRLVSHLNKQTETTK
jgi:transketolase